MAKIPAGFWKEFQKAGNDPKVLKRRFVDDEELFITSMREFLNGAPIRGLRAALKSGDDEQLFEAVHRIKGTSGTLGLTPLYEAACVAVRDLRAGKVLRPAQIKEIEAEYADAAWLLE